MTAATDNPGTETLRRGFAPLNRSADPNDTPPTSLLEAFRASMLAQWTLQNWAWVARSLPDFVGFPVAPLWLSAIVVTALLVASAMNPARTFGTLIGGLGDTADLWSQHWLYWVGPVVGALLAAFVYDKCIMERSAE